MTAANVVNGEGIMVTRDARERLLLVSTMMHVLTRLQQDTSTFQHSTNILIWSMQ